MFFYFLVVWICVNLCGVGVWKNLFKDILFFFSTRDSKYASTGLLNGQPADKLHDNETLLLVV